MPADLHKLPKTCRHRFPIFETKVYVNSCSQGALSDAVRASYDAYLRDWDEEGAPWEYWIERTESARAAFAKLINASPEEIAVTTSLSAGVASLASGLRFAGPRNKVVLTEWEFPTIGQIWHAQESRGARVVHVQEAADGTIPLKHFKSAIDDETKLVSITHVCFRNGALLDPKPVVKLAHERGAPVLLDAYQSIGSMPIDVKALGVDFLAAGVLKYLLGSAGLGFLYCRRELWQEAWPTATGWFADQNVFEMDIHDYSPAADARRFQSGTPPVPSIYAGIAGIELMQEIGIDKTRNHVRRLTELLIEGVDDLRGTVVTPRNPAQRGALVCIKSTDVELLVAELAKEGIVTSSRDGNLRISPHAYNTPEDIKAVLWELARHRRLLA
ncbi:MAG: aminotransferase class V-fold PLP-dependent enzyme [Gaiellaceae bacterium]